MQIIDGLNFDDVTLMPGKLVCKASEINLKSNITQKININIPMMSTALEKITEASMAIAISRQGGVGVIHKEMSIEDQATEVDKVKRSQHGVITDPFYLSPNNYVSDAEEIMAKYKISGVPICENRKLIGIVTNRDLKFETDKEKKIYEVMTCENLITAPEGTDIEDAKKILAKNKIEKLPIVDENFWLKGLITTKDIDKLVKYPNASHDDAGRLLVAAAVGCDGDFIERAQELEKTKVDIIILDSIYGYSEKFLDALKVLRKSISSNLEIIAGNIATPIAVQELIEAGANAIKVGFGTSVFGVGVPQLTAIYNCKEVAKKYNIPIISDSNIKNSGDIIKALAAGANACMLGDILKDCEESCSQQNRLRDANNNYNYSSIINGVNIKNNNNEPLRDITKNLSDGLRLGMYYCGASSIEKLQENAKFIRSKTFN